MTQYYIKTMVDAIQYLGDNFAEVIDFTGGKAVKHEVLSQLQYNDKTIEYGDYVALNQGKIEVYKPHEIGKKFNIQN